MNATVLPTRRALVAGLPFAALTIGGKKSTAKQKKRVKPLIVAAARATSFAVTPNSDTPQFAFTYHIEGYFFSDPVTPFAANFPINLETGDFSRIPTLLKRSLVATFGVQDESLKRVTLYIA